MGLVRFNPIKCAECGKFMSYDDLVMAKVYTPYGNCLDLEPPDGEFIHRRCYDSMSYNSKLLLHSISWQEGR